MVDFTEKTTLKEVLEFSGGEEVLSKYNVPCLSCPMAQMEMSGLTLKDICAAYRIDLKNLLIDLNLATQNNYK
jgi:cytochrome c551/c552